MEKRVGIFGGSFDPVHNGHVRIAKSFLNSGLIHQLLIIPSPSPPHKKENRQTEFFHRFKMLVLAFEQVKNVYISDVEKNLPKPSYTVQTIDHLRGKYPDSVFYLCLGQDSLRDFHKWHRYQDILDQVHLIVAKRPEIDTSDVDPDILEKTIFIDHDPVPASSTAIRKSGGQYHENLPESVADYIKKNNLYMNNTD